MDLPRAAGVQLHLTSLPDGRLGPSAYAFVDWLAAAGQSVWQMLPLGPPDKYGSPYKATSAFAAWEGLLAEPDAPVSDAEVADFTERNAYWVGSWPDVAPQVRFEREWSALRRYANDRGVRLMGDVPIYVAPGSADEQAWPQFFRSDAVAGVPPDAYATTGQLWGNPLYDWDALAADDYAWWTERFRRTFAQFDLVRVDHFRAFSAYWEVPVDAETAMEGRWVDGPGRAPFDAAERALGTLPVVAEDLGDIDDPVLELRDALGFPGMAVLQFAFDPDDTEHGTHEPDNLVEHQAVYTGTHDSDTVVGWWSELEAAAPEERPRRLRRPGRGGQLGDDPPRLVGAVAAGDDAGPGHPRPRLGGAHERARHPGQVVEVAPRAGRPDRRPRRPAARAHRTRKEGLTLLSRGLVALGDSITRGRGGAPALGVHPQSWAQWVAEALELPFTNLAVDGAIAADVLRDQVPRLAGPYDLATLYVGANDARGELDADAYDGTCAAIVAALREAADRVLVLTVPLDLGPAPRRPGRRDRQRRSCAGSRAWSCARWTTSRAPRFVLPDAVHPTSPGMVEIADRALAALGSSRRVDVARHGWARYWAWWGWQAIRDHRRRWVESRRT